MAAEREEVFGGNETMANDIDVAVNHARNEMGQPTVNLTT
jgi:hypothetical protein